MRLPHLTRTLALGAALACAAHPTPAALNVPLGFAGDPASTAWSGAKQGLAEAQIQGDFLGQTYTLTPRLTEVSAIIAAVPPAALKALALAHPGVPVLNVSRTEDTLRSDCLPNLLHVIPSDHMRADAQAQWQKAHPGSGAEARAWHSDFEKYAAAQLNHRYAEATGKAMDDAAWAGWAAVKLVSDMVAREQTTDASTLLEALRTRLAFDGQKGQDLSFRDNGQLRQPLLLIEANKIVGEAPVRGVAEVENLDSLGPVACANAH